MANYNSNKAIAGIQPKLVHNGDLAVLATYSFTSGAQLATNDTITMMTIPAGATMTGITLDVDKLDAGGSPTIKLNVGDSLVGARFVSQSTAGQSGGYQVPNVNAGMGYLYANNTPLLLTVQTSASTTMGAATVRLIANYTIDP